MVRKVKAKKKREIMQSFIFDSLTLLKEFYVSKMKDCIQFINAAVSILTNNV